MPAPGRKRRIKDLKRLPTWVAGKPLAGWVKPGKKAQGRDAESGGQMQGTGIMSDEERSNLVYEKIIKIKEKEMSKAVKELDFETAAILRDEIGVLKLRLEKK